MNKHEKKIIIMEKKRITNNIWLVLPFLKVVPSGSIQGWLCPSSSLVLCSLSFVLCYQLAIFLLSPIILSLFCVVKGFYVLNKRWAMGHEKGCWERWWKMVHEEWQGCWEWHCALLHLKKISLNFCPNKKINIRLKGHIFHLPFWKDILTSIFFYSGWNMANTTIHTSPYQVVFTCSNGHNF